MSDKRFQRLMYVGTILFSILFLVVGHRLASSGLTLFDRGGGPETLTAKVAEILHYWSTEPDPNASEPEETLRITFEADLLTGMEKGKAIIGVQTADSFTPTEIRKVRSGDRIIVYEMEEAEHDTPDRWVLQEFVRTPPLVALFLLFTLLLIVFGRLKGLNTIISLMFTCLAVFGIFIPSVLSGGNIYLSSFAVCIFIIAMTLLLVNGANSKSFAAGTGCAGGIVVCGLLVLVSNLFLGLTGLLDEQSVFLLYLNPGAPINLKAVIFSAIVIGALGATLDVSVSIASALSEIHEVSPRIPFSHLFKSGMNIGRDIMGTMANTLVLAYIGSSLAMVLLLLVNSNSLTDMLNREIVVVEILQALVGSIGLLCTIPLTSLISAYVYTRRRAQRGVRPRHVSEWIREHNKNREQ